MKIEIKEEIAKKLKKRVNELEEFSSVDEYVGYILEQVIEKLEKENKIEKDSVSSEDEKKVKERLRSLGYLD